MLRVAIAMVAAPVAVWAVLFALALALHPDPAGSGLLQIGPFVGVWLVMVAGMVGVPLVIVLRRYGLASLWPCVVAGALTGLAMLVLITGGIRGLAAGAGRIAVMPLGYAITGAAIGAVFWWTGIRRNPWFASGESRLEALAVHAAAAANANAHETGRTVGRIFATIPRTVRRLRDLASRWVMRRCSSMRR